MVDGLRDLIALMEERYGWWGRVYAHLVIHAAGLFIIGLAAATTHAALKSWLGDLPVASEGTAQAVMIFGVSFAIYLAVMVIVNGVFIQWSKQAIERDRERAIQELEQVRTQNRRMVREYLRALEKIAAELRAQGVKLSTEMLDAQKVLLTAQLDAEDEEESRRG